MFKKLKTFIVSISAGLTLLLPAVAVPALVHAAEIQNNLCGGANLSFSDAAGCTDPGAENSVNNIVTLVINIFSIVVGIVAVIMIIIGGVKYITSGGDATNVGAAKNTILYAIIGLVVVALAQILVRYVLAKVNSSVTGG